MVDKKRESLRYRLEHELWRDLWPDAIAVSTCIGHVCEWLLEYAEEHPQQTQAVLKEVVDVIRSESMDG